jgi:hypothetical protein
VSKFCRHGTLTERCPICHASVEAAARAPAPRRRSSATDTRPRRQISSRGGLTVRYEARADDDGYRSPLAPGLRSTQDARRLAREISFAVARLAALVGEPPGLYAKLATEPDIEEATWLALLIAYLGPLESEQPFSAIEAAHIRWGELPELDRWGVLPELEHAQPGPRTAHDPSRGSETLFAYRRFAQRAGSQQIAFTGDPTWTPAQRFARIYERLALPGLHRRARYDLLVTLGCLGRYPLAAPGLLLTEEDPVTLAAKRVFAIGDRLTLERRARKLAAAAAAPVEALDLALENWARSERITQGFHGADEAAELRALAALNC